jgi:hypothetical protein
MEGQGDNEELYPIAVLIDELKVGLLPSKMALYLKLTSAPSTTMCSSD